MNSVRSRTRWLAAGFWCGLVLYMGILARLTLWPEPSQRPVWDRINSGSRAASSGRIDPHHTEMLANVALFLPFGFLLAMVVHRTTVVVFAAAALSVAIELSQHWWLPSRDGSVRDVALNTLGGALGCAIGWACLRFARRSMPRSYSYLN